MTNSSMRVPPLFHGTSAIFLRSIATQGLGGRNIISEWRALDFYRDVIAACRDASDVALASLAKSDRRNDAILAQTAGTFNWRHGAVYASVDRRKAISYAYRNTYGSELITFAFGWLSDLERSDPGVGASLLRRYPELLALHDATTFPVVIKVQGLTINDLETESGKNGDAVVQVLHLATEYCKSASGILNASFALMRSIPWSDLIVYRLVCQGRPNRPSFNNVRCVKLPRVPLGPLD
jgi:hypothetical protein